MGEMTFADFDAELVARGFDAFSPQQRARYINWGYRRIARKARWLWEQTSQSFTVQPGSTGLVVTSDPAPIQPASGTIYSFKSLVKVVERSPNKRHLKALKDEEFFDSWFPLDLTAAANRANPSHYFLWGDALYLIPPPDAATVVEVHWKQSVTALANAGDIPITPADYDEAILLAALVRAHKRANEVILSQQAAGELNEFFEDMANDESFEDEDQLERVLPDDTWA